MPTATPAPMPCPVCRGEGARLFARARDVEYCTGTQVYRYFRCRQCRAVYLDRPPVDRLHEIYPPNYYSYARDQRKPILEAVKRRLDSRLLARVLRGIPGERLSVLDVGGGWGWLLSLVREVSPRVAETHEVDIDESARAEAEAAGHHFHCTPIEEFRAARPFDLILLLNLIEHVADPAAVLHAMRRLLTPGGLILLKTPNTDTLDRRLFRHRNWGGFHCPRHWVLFTREGLTRLAERCGLAVVDAKYTQGGTQWAMSILALLAERKLINISASRPMYGHPLAAPLFALGAAFDYLRLPFARTAQMFLTLKRAG